MRPLWSTGLLVVLAVLMTFVPPRRREAEQQESAAEATRIGLVFDVGGRGDKSFNDAAYLGLLRAERELGVTASFLEPVGSEDRESALRLFAARHMDLVIAVGFIFTSDVDAVARAYPEVHFACVDYAGPPPSMPANVAGLSFREEEGSFLVGAVAGLMSKTHHVGFIGGMTIPLIRKFEAGYVAGVEAACPDCAIEREYAGSTPDAFKDPARGKSLAAFEVAAGADVLFHASGATGHGVFEEAKDARVLAIGVDADQYDEMPGTVVTSMVKRVDVAVYEAIKDATHGTFRGGSRVFGLGDDGIDYVHEGPHAAKIPDAVKARVAALRAEVTSGARTVPHE
jgi:basic membrane protein A and related proteins